MIEPKRSELEIHTKILEICKNPSKKTRIIYQINTNFTLGGKYIQSLLKSKLLEETDNGYKTTQKGEKLIGLYKEIEEYYGE